MDLVFLAKIRCLALFLGKVQAFLDSQARGASVFGTMASKRFLFSVIHVIFDHFYMRGEVALI